MPYSGGGGILTVTATPDPATTAWVNQVITNGGTVSATRQTLVNNLITGLKADGVWTQLDRLWILAAENNQSARTDMVGLILASVSGSPAFAIDRGYTGVDVSTPAVDYLDCGTSSRPGSGLTQFALNSCHASAWCVTNNAVASGGCLMGGGNTNTTTETNIFDTFTDGNVYGRINDNPQGGGTALGATRAGHWTISRTGATTNAIYQNATSFSTPNASAGTSFTGHQNFTILCQNDTTNGTVNGTPNQVAMASLGAGLSSSDVTSFYNRLRIYMTAVGVP